MDSLSLTKSQFEKSTALVAELKSGKHIQGSGFLFKDGKKCCLGVALDMLYPNCWVNKTIGFERPTVNVCTKNIEGIISSPYYLSLENLEIFGLRDEDQVRLSKLNDCSRNYLSAIEYLEKEVLTRKVVD